MSDEPEKSESISCCQNEISDNASLSKTLNVNFETPVDALTVLLAPDIEAVRPPHQFQKLEICLRVINEGSLPEIVQYGPSSSFVLLLLPKDLTIIFICYYCSWCCAVSPRTSSIVQIIFFF